MQQLLSIPPLPGFILSHLKRQTQCEGGPPQRQSTAAARLHNRWQLNLSLSLWTACSSSPCSTCSCSQLRGAIPHQPHPPVRLQAPAFFFHFFMCCSTPHY